ncbi:hypothetical protein D8674_018351 [Pyrus ussuriensis x Pyrus communis]|uniref:Uncharacterized protein n=1 Tax=Pyrus ussuriensis x Pyrus communis TaxID=2448454 RepID=A0A5N5G4I3_9ROSA|nr:hypothetical protein D8674_018351 [Pyrus ussuriensis x Pyrus communis]
MGTEVQSKMYFPGYCSIQNLSSNVVNGSWSLLHENTNLKNGQQYEVFLTRLVIDGFHECDKVRLRQTILKHETILVYGRQSISSTCISQPPCDSIGKTLRNSGDHESLDSRVKKPRRRLFNLELPADEYLSDEEEPERDLGSGTDKSDYKSNSTVVDCSGDSPEKRACGPVDRLQRERARVEVEAQAPGL